MPKSILLRLDREDKWGKKDKAQLFTLDVLLALVPLVIVIGISANAFTGVASQMQDYVFGYGMQRVADSAADVLIKTRGEPANWNANNIKTPGFATTQTFSACVSASPYVLSNVIELQKLNIINSSLGNSSVKGALYNLTGGYNIRIEVINKTPTNTTNQTTVLDVAGYSNGGVWATTSSNATINSLLANAKEIRISERAIGIVPGGSSGENMTPKWNYSSGFSANIQSTPAVGDLDGDGDREIVFGSSGPINNFADDYVYALDKDGNEIWRFKVAYDLWQSSPALADINNDGRLEVLIGSKWNQVNLSAPVLYALNYDGTLLWSVNASTLGDEVQATPAIANVDGDSGLEIAVSTSKNGRNVFLIEPNGAVKWSYDTSCRFRTSPAIADVDGDGSLEIVYASDPEPAGCTVNGTYDNITVFSFSGAGTLEWRYDITDRSGSIPHYHSSPAVADIDADGGIEVVQMNNGISGNPGLYGNLRVLYGANGTLKRQTTLNVYGESSPALADLDDDGKLEIVVGSKDGYTYALYSNLSMKWRTNTGQISWSSPAIGDVDGDCELEAVILNKAGTLYVLNGEDGSIQQSRSITTSTANDASPILVDIDDDQLLEIVVGTGNGKLYTFDTPGTGVEWPTFHQCIKRAGYFYDDDCAGSLAFPTLQNPASDASEGLIRITVWR